MIKGAQLAFTRGDLIIFATMLFLFAELVKATYTSSVSLVDHGLSMLVFIVCIVEFLVVNAAATSTFFFILLGTLIDVVAGFTIGIRVARRDLSIGGSRLGARRLSARRRIDHEMSACLKTATRGRARASRAAPACWRAGP